MATNLPSRDPAPLDPARLDPASPEPMTPEPTALEPSKPSANEPSARANAIGVAAMLVSMAAFVINDTCVKLASNTLPIGEIIAIRNVSASLVLLAAMVMLGDRIWPRRLPVRLIGLRVVGEVCSTILFLVALVSLPLADITAIAQVTPLALTAAAAIFLGEQVGWRRWTATAIGFLGVALIVRPGSAAFSTGGAMVLASIVFVVMRDLVTRMIPMTVSTGFISLTSALSGILAGLFLLPFETWRPPTLAEATLAASAGVFLAIGFAMIVVALRTGDVSVVSPFRYTVIVFALLAGYVVWNEAPDALALAGTAIVCGAGLYTLHRERIRQRADAASVPVTTFASPSSAISSKSRNHKEH
jgi:drug/metabolite transporter (DMT)-like permease